MFLWQTSVSILNSLQKDIYMNKGLPCHCCCLERSRLSVWRILLPPLYPWRSWGRCRRRRSCPCLSSLLPWRRCGNPAAPRIYALESCRISIKLNGSKGKLAATGINLLGFWRGSGFLRLIQVCWESKVIKRIHCSFFSKFKIVSHSRTWRLRRVANYYYPSEQPISQWSAGWSSSKGIRQLEMIAVWGRVK